MHPALLNAAQLSTHLKSLRQAHGLTQAQLGARIGVKQARIADIEKNPGAISVDQLLQLLHALETRLLLAPAAAPKATKTADW
ncbi:helix-turn-helix domain-containing protein [Pseudorhodoferax sp. Leaf267]|uniref:helix-turn-helix domain-containing protein n=1 Tax=Pseudorhodoferax sp. Leaf267 TaxID=1736316 RepID=UPI0006FFBAF4|nr:helix-turn-helix domain-containing protein [Pseudorhodoferax sp. Leaf267]KQP13090.1 transcriptional regulator [Pseudorhodoferax sp. Leaf267]